MAEAHRLLGGSDAAGTQSIKPEHFLPRELLTVAVALESVVDLTGNGYTQLQLSADDLAGSFGPCQRVGEIIAAAGFDGVLAPAATGLGETLAVYADGIELAAHVELVDRSEWSTLPPDPSGLAAAGPSEIAEEPYISAAQVAWRLGKVDTALVAHWRKSGMPSLRLSERKFVYKFSEVERWLSGRDWS